MDIAAGEETVDKIKEIVKSTFNDNVLSGIGHFGAFYKVDFAKYKEPVMVSSVDGVGTKLKVAFMMDTHNTVGQDLVNHCVNDIAVCGATPLYFMDYMAFGKLVPAKAEQPPGTTPLLGRCQLWTEMGRASIKLPALQLLLPFFSASWAR